MAACYDEFLNIDATMDYLDSEGIPHDNIHIHRLMGREQLLKITNIRKTGIILIDDRFYYALSTGRWRNKNNTLWYRSKGIKDFVNRFVKKGRDNGRQLGL